CKIAASVLRLRQQQRITDERIQAEPKLDQVWQTVTVGIESIRGAAGIRRGSKVALTPCLNRGQADAIENIGRSGIETIVVSNRVDAPTAAVFARGSDH